MQTKKRMEQEMEQKAVAGHFYKVECFDKLGKWKWTEEFENIIVTAGLNKYLDATFKTGLASPAWYVGLKDTGNVVAGDILSSHTGWAELDVYTGDRKPFVPGTISGGSVSNSGNKAAFTIDVADTIYGAFLCDALSGNSGTLMGAGNFTSPRVVEIGDTLNVTITPSIAAV
jgi:hypothetical protein